MVPAAYASVEAVDADADAAQRGEMIQAAPPCRLERLGRMRVLIASGQPIVRHGLRALLAAEADMDVIGEAEDGGAAVRLARQLRPDLVVIDLLIPEVDGISATRMIRDGVPGTRVVVMASVSDDVPAVESIRAGASAYLPMATRTDAVLHTIRGVGAGQVALPSQAAARLVRVVGRHDALSEREAEVLRLVAQGKANKEIAQELDIAQSTVKSHVGSILGKLGLQSRSQIVLYAARTGLVSLARSAAR